MDDHSVCKTVASGFESRRHIHASVCQQDRLPSSKRAIDVRVIAEAPSRWCSTGQSHRLLSDCVGVRVVPSRPIYGKPKYLEGQPARCRRSLLRMRHRQRCGDRVSGLPRGRGVTATCLASNQRSPGQHRASAPCSVGAMASISVLQTEDDGSKPSRSTNSLRRLRRGLRPLKPDSSARHREPLPSRSFRRRGGSHKAARCDRHARSGPCCLCSMAMSTPAVNRWDGVRIAGAVPIWEFGVMTAQRPPTPLAWV